MRLLLVSDEEDRYLWDFYRPGNLEGIDMILSAGDLKAEYLSFLVTMSNKPLLYVHGNHDAEYDRSPPEGCECIDDRLVTVNGLRILGLGGCQYRAGGVDIVLTHAPVRGYGDEESVTHRGFETFLPLLDRWEPRYLIHGHVHRRYQPRQKEVLQHGNTTIINANGKYYLEL